jgi:hypothetical protein
VTGRERLEQRAPLLFSPGPGTSPYRLTHYI